MFAHRFGVVARQKDILSRFNVSRISQTKLYLNN